MRVLWVLLIGGALGLPGCGKDPAPAPALKSVDGKWTYETPDSKISVDFELVSTSSGSLDILNSTITVNGTQGQSAAQIFDVDLPAIDSIRINANDAVLTNPYYIAFSDCTVTADFNSIMVLDAVYTYPLGTIKLLTGVLITRKP